MSWADGFLGLIALATLTMAVVQVGAIVAAARLARQAQQVLTTVQQDIRPLVAKANDIAGEASRTAAMAAAQAEKVDRLVTDLAARADYTAGIVQEAIVVPAREGIAIFAALRAALGVLRGGRNVGPRNGRHAEEEDPLFIG